MSNKKYMKKDVLKGIQCCIRNNPLSSFPAACSECPFKAELTLDTNTFCINVLLAEAYELLTTFHKPKNEVPVKVGQKVWVLCGSSIRRLPVIAVGKDVAILSELSLYGDTLYSSISFNDLGKTWFTRISDAKKAYKEHPTFVTPKADKITFIKINNDTYSIRTKTKL